MNDRRIEIQGGGDGTGFKLSVYFDRLPQMALPKYRKLLHLYFIALSVYPQPDTLRQWLEDAAAKCGEGKRTVLAWRKRYTLYLEIERKYTHV